MWHPHWGFQHFINISQPPHVYKISYSSLCTFFNRLNNIGWKWPQDIQLEKLKIMYRGPSESQHNKHVKQKCWRQHIILQLLHYEIHILACFKHTTVFNLLVSHASQILVNGFKILIQIQWGIHHRNISLQKTILAVLLLAWAEKWFSNMQSCNCCCMMLIFDTILNRKLGRRSISFLIILSLWSYSCSFFTYL
jgi:hypothetical protein